jgi:thioredoxin reductase (NADPH)
MTDIENTIIVGSGPAGYTAALYTARANLRPLVIEGFSWGGLLQQTTDVENYPGFPDGIVGPELMSKMRAQAERFGARLETDQVERIQLASGSDPAHPGVHSVWVGETEHRARTVILAMGAEHKRLAVPGEQELGGKGVSYCATCDAAFFKDAPTMIVGGGDSAMEEAIFLSKFAAKVVVVHRREEFRASKIMLQRARERENIELLTPYTVKAFLPGESGALDRALLVRTGTDGERLATSADAGASQELELAITGAFIAIGHEPQSELVRGQVDVDENGYVRTKGHSTRTNRPGVFAAGDLVDHTYRQAVTAAGSGCQAALDAEWYLRDTPQVPTPAGIPIGDLAEEQWAPPEAVQTAGGD